MNAAAFRHGRRRPGGFFAAPEVSVAVSLLRFIDNPLLDVPLLAVMLSPAFGFTPDDCARIRMADKNSPLYVAVRGMSAGRAICPPVRGLLDPDGSLSPAVRLSAGGQADSSAV